MFSANPVNYGFAYKV